LRCTGSQPGYRAQSRLAVDSATAQFDLLRLDPNLQEYRMNLLEWNDVALAKYLTTNPDLKTEIQDLSAEEQKQQTQWAFEDEAEALDIEPWELALQLVAESPEHLQSMRLEAHQQVAETLGMDWDEYRKLNDIEE
jgi:hypothetical protein